MGQGPLIEKAPVPVGLFVLILLTAVAFWPGLSAGFLYDDLRDVVENPAAQAETFAERLPQTVRPLLKASYALQDAMTGPSPFAFHAVNLGLHLATTLMVLALLRRAAGLAGHAADVAARIGWMAALVWAVHPALADTVTYVSGRSAGLSTFLVIGCLLAATATRPRWPLAFLLAFLAPLARETALVAPVLLLAWQLCLGRSDGSALALRRALPVWLGALAAMMVIAAMARHRELVAFSLDQRAPLDAIRANLFAIPEILRLWLAPSRISILPTQPVIHGWADQLTLFRLIGLAILPLLAVALRRRAPMVALAILWTLLALMPTNSVIWRVEPVATRPLYLAGIGLSLLTAVALSRVPVGHWLALVLASGLAVASWQRATLYQDEVALFADAAERSPDNARAHLMYGLVLSNAGRSEEARLALETALVIDPYLPGAENALRLLDAGADVYSAPP